MKITLHAHDKINAAQIMIAVFDAIRYCGKRRKKATSIFSFSLDVYKGRFLPVLRSLHCLMKVQPICGLMTLKTSGDPKYHLGLLYDYHYIDHIYPLPQNPDV